MGSKATATALALYALSVFSIFLTGCATAGFLAHPDLAQRISGIKSIALLPPRIDVYELGMISSGRVAGWSDTATANISDAATLQLKSLARIQSERVLTDSLSDAQKDELRDVQSLLDAVRTSVQVHVQGGTEQRFPAKQSDFDYSLGTFNEITKSTNTDAFLLLQGVDHITSPGHRALNAALLLTSAAAAGGARMVLIPIVNLGTTWVSASLVDSRTGDILWYRNEMSTGGYDLRDSESAIGFVRKLFEGFPH